MKTVLPLGAAGDLATAGGKGASLARLVGAGMPVPDGFVVTTGAYRAFTAPFRDEMLEAAAAGDHARIARPFASHDLPADLADELRAGHATLSAGVPRAGRAP